MEFVRDSRTATNTADEGSYRAAMLAAQARLGVTRVRRAGASTPAQIAKTVVACVFFLTLTPMLVRLIALYRDYPAAQMGLVGLIVGGGIAVHLWPTVSPPWRTLAWAMFTMIPVGSISLMLGLGSYALTLATFVGYFIVVMRVNANGRRIAGLVRTWRSL